MQVNLENGKVAVRGVLEGSHLKLQSSNYLLGHSDSELIEYLSRSSFGNFYVPYGCGIATWVYRIGIAGNSKKLIFVTFLIDGRGGKYIYIYTYTLLCTNVLGTHF
ncbi:hypothetical protein PIB30_078612 [Stylosanthes scabra]|uniref:Uncharacterized protein n=1 Tax=Stylosanthes scabra TaxID=79078 RepID=A0ABU6ZPQ3_9FABA|nr:hypothetical protein [Stylosanthes scabra]